jgi:Arc/MetJ-type ribon-helix-helix transcriptional regulator
MHMQIQLTKEHEEWLRSQVAAGRFSTLEEAVAEAIDSLKTEDDDLARAKPLVEEGVGELDRGQAIPAEEVFARIEARLREKLLHGG